MILLPVINRISLNCALFGAKCIGPEIELKWPLFCSQLLIISGPELNWSLFYSVVSTDRMNIGTELNCPLDPDDGACWSVGLFWNLFTAGFCIITILRIQNFKPKWISIPHHCQQGCICRFMFGGINITHNIRNVKVSKNII